MNKSITFILRIPIDYDRANWIPTLDWVKARIRLFHELTLKSILNQSFQDFRIFMICGNRNKNMTQNAKWHERCELCYDDGRSKLESIETDYISITRIDSDDLFHKDALADVRDNLLLTNKRECLIFRKCYRWDMVNRLINIFYRSSPPTYTHIFPKAIYKNWSLFQRQHIVTHGRAGGKLPTTIELPPFKVCIVKHWLNNNRMRHEMPLNVMSESERQQFATNPHVSWDNVILDRDRIKEILRDFGVDDKWIK